MATGLLVLGSQAATRLLAYVVGSDKTYLATLRLGQASETDDAEGPLGPKAAPERLTQLTERDITQGLGALTGEIMQVPSRVSAIRIAGKRAHAMVRSGEVVDIAPRPVTVHALQLLQLRYMAEVIECDIAIDCSSGTYVRAIARDLGANLGVGGHLSALRRTRVGDFQLSEAQPLDEWSARPQVIPAARAAARVLPSLPVSPAQARELRFGRRIPASDSKAASPAAAIAPPDDLVAVVVRLGDEWQVRTGFPEAAG